MNGKQEWIIIRHGEAAHMVGDNPLTGGWTDTALTSRGREQAALTGRSLAAMPKLFHENSDRFGFFCSDLQRARETAEIIGQCIGSRPESCEALREFNNGCASGMTKVEASRVVAPMTPHVGDWRPYEEGENWWEFLARVRHFAEARLAFGNQLLVCHSGTAFNLVFHFLGLEDNHLGQIYSELDPCGITRLGISAYGERTIVRLNDVSHLKDLSESLAMGG